MGVSPQRVARGRSVEALGRMGLLAQGTAFAIVALLAIELALGRGGSTTDPHGALHALAGHPDGRVLLVLLALGFAGHALWRVAQALFDRDGEGSGAKGFGARALHLGRAAIYGGLCVSAILLLAGSGGGGSSSPKKATAGILGWPGGRWLVIAVGIGFFVAAVWNAYGGVTKRFMDDMRTSKLHHGATGLVERIGEIGFLARSVVFGIVGWFLVKAALEYDPQDAVGLGGALSRLAHETYGRWLLGITAAGLLAFGVFCAVQARYGEV